MDPGEDRRCWNAPCSPGWGRSLRSLAAPTPFVCCGQVRPPGSGVVRVGAASPASGSLRSSAVGGGHRLGGLACSHGPVPLWLPERLCWATCRHRLLLGAQAFPRPWPVAWPCQDPCHLPGAGVRCVLTLVLVSAAAPRFRAQAGLSLERRTLDVCQSRASVTLNLVRFLIREMFFHTKYTGSGRLPHLGPGPGGPGRLHQEERSPQRRRPPRATLHRGSARSVSLGRCGCSSRSRGGRAERVLEALAV